MTQRNTVSYSYQTVSINLAMLYVEAQESAVGKRNHVLLNIDSEKRKQGDNTLCKVFIIDSMRVHLLVRLFLHRWYAIKTITIREQL